MCLLANTVNANNINYAMNVSCQAMCTENSIKTVYRTMLEKRMCFSGIPFGPVRIGHRNGRALMFFTNYRIKIIA